MRINKESAIYCQVQWKNFSIQRRYNGKGFQSKANRPLVNICMGDITNKFEQVLGGGRGPKVNKFEQVLVVPMLEGGAWGWGWGQCPQVKKFEQVHVWSHRDLSWTDRQTRLKTLPFRTTLRTVIVQVSKGWRQ